MAFSVSVPLTDPVAEAKIAEAYRNDPGASLSGSYVTTQKAIDVRMLKRAMLSCR